MPGPAGCGSASGGGTMRCTSRFLTTAAARSPPAWRPVAGWSACASGCTPSVANCKPVAAAPAPGSGSSPSCRCANSRPHVDEAVRVLVVDDQALVRDGLTVILAAVPDIVVVGEAANGAEAVEAAVALHPDVVLM